MTASPSAPVGRPVVDASFLEGVDDAEVIQEFIDEHNQDCAELEARGPLTVRFLDDADHGYLTVCDYVERTFESLPARGVIDIPTYTRVDGGELHHLSPEAVRELPLEHLPGVQLYGGSDAVLRSLAARPDLTTISLDALITDAEVEFRDREIAAEIEMDRAELEMGGDMAVEIPLDSVEYTNLLTVGGEVISDAGYASLAAATHLTELRVRGTQVSDETVSEVVASMSSLQSFDLQSDRLTGGALTALARLPLVNLSLDSAALTGAAVNTSPEFPELYALALFGSALFDDLDIPHLAETFPALETLDIGPARGTLPTAEQTARLHLAFPGVAVNGREMTERGARKMAAKLGVEA